jgi:hypothetical protein
MRSRVRLADATRAAAVRWGQQRLTELLVHGGDKPREVPTLAQFADRFVEEYAIANRQKPSTIASKRLVLTKHLIPQLGRKRLDEIRHEDIQKLKSKLVHLNPKTVNGILTVLSKLLKISVDWQILETMPCTIRLVKAQLPELPFYDFEDFEMLVEGAKRVGPETLAAVLLGGHAGLRRGEIGRPGVVRRRLQERSPHRSPRRNGRARSSRQRGADRGRSRCPRHEEGAERDPAPPGKSRLLPA